MFTAICDEAIPKMDVDMQAPFDAISRTVGMFHGTARQVKRASRPTSSFRAHAWIAHWVLAACTAHRRGDADRVNDALARVGDVAITSMSGAGLSCVWSLVGSSTRRDRQASGFRSFRPGVLADICRR